jgi:TrkA domain protein
MVVRRIDLPGVGTKHTLDLEGGGQLVAVHHRVGHWEFARVSADGDTTPLVSLPAKEAEELGRILARETAAEEDNRREILFRTIGLEWVTLDEDSPLPGKTLEESGIRPRTGASVIAVLRGDDSIPNPPPGFRFEADDTLVVLGHREQVEVFLATFARAPGSA